MVRSDGVGPGADRGFHGWFRCFWPADLAESKIRRIFAAGEMAEWSIAAVLKTVEPQGSGGSNPSLSAINAENQQIIKQTPNFTPKNVKLGVFILFKTNHIRSENNLIKNRTNEKNNQFIFRKISYLCSK